MTGGVVMAIGLSCLINHLFFAWRCDRQRCAQLQPPRIQPPSRGFKTTHIEVLIYGIMGSWNHAAFKYLIGNRRSHPVDEPAHLGSPRKSCMAPASSVNAADPFSASWSHDEFWYFSTTLLAI
jgi:hypothetical protein